MFGNAHSLLKQRPKCNVVVGYGSQPRIPEKMTRMMRDHPVASSTITVKVGDLKITPFEVLDSYESYRERNLQDTHADARILDALFDQAVKAKSLYCMCRHFGVDSGQFFFLGTSFISTSGIECVSFINMRTMPSLPALRYQQPVHDLANFLVPTYAVRYEPKE